jgi:hypothetical protein
MKERAWDELEAACCANFASDFNQSLRSVTLLFSLQTLTLDYSFDRTARWHGVGRHAAGRLVDIALAYKVARCLATGRSQFDLNLQGHDGRRGLQTLTLASGSAASALTWMLCIFMMICRINRLCCLCPWQMRATLLI